MADELADQHDSLDEELEQYMEDDEPGWFQEFLSEQVRRSPWWAISL
ncbi:hypothetical protein HQ576_11160, partial [bacterium]|nr:hypothetical protein [bacterium]